MKVQASELAEPWDEEEPLYEHWVAIEGGGFEQCAEKDALVVFGRSLKPCALRKTISKRKSTVKLPTGPTTRSQTRPRARVKTNRLRF